MTVRLKCRKCRGPFSAKNAICAQMNSAQYWTSCAVGSTAPNTVCFAHSQQPTLMKGCPSLKAAHSPRSRFSVHRTSKVEELFGVVRFPFQQHLSPAHAHKNAAGAKNRDFAARVIYVLRSHLRLAVDSS